MDDVQFAFNEKQEVFASLITSTMGSPHGRFPLQQEDDNGNVWEFQLPLSRTVAWRLLWEATGATAPTSYAQEEVRVSILPRSNEYVIFSGDRDFIWSLFQSDGRYYVMRANGKRYFDLLLRGRFRTDADGKVYEALRQLYGV